MTSAAKKPAGRPYNGFSWEERRSTDRAFRASRAVYGSPIPLKCSVCAIRPEGGVKFHSEVYTMPLNPYAVCRRCHYAIHIRFSRPLFWQKFIKGIDPDCWVQMLSLDPATLTRPFNVTYPQGLPQPNPDGLILPSHKPFRFSE